MAILYFTAIPSIAQTGDAVVKWPRTFTIAQAREAQEWMQKKISINPLSREPRIVAGVDAALSDDKVFAAACLYKFPE